MATTFTIGTMLYALAVAADAWLAGRLVHVRAYRQYPVFTAFTCFVAVENFVMFPLFVARHFADFQRVYAVARPIGLVLTLAVCAEVLRHAWDTPRLARSLQFAAVVPGVMLGANFHLDADRGLRLVVGLVCLACLPRARTMPAKAFGILTGMFASEILPAIVERQTVLDARPVLQYVTTASFLLGLAIWIAYWHGEGQANRAEAFR